MNTRVCLGQDPENISQKRLLFYHSFVQMRQINF